MLHLKYKVSLSEPEIEFNKLAGGKALATDHRVLNFNIEIKRVFLAKYIYRRAQGRGFSPGSSIAGNWSRCILCDIVTKASVAFVASTDPDVHFKCCMSADTEIQTFIKGETEVKPIKPRCAYSGALDKLISQQSTSKCSLLLLFKFRLIAFKLLVVIRLVVVQDSVVIKKRRIKTYDFHLLLAFPRSAGECTEGSYQDNGYG